MRFRKSLLATTLAAGLAASLSAHAAPFGIYDPRSLGMGGVGVTMATGRNANFYNPAMLSATRDDEKFALGLPIVAARVTDQDKLIDDVDDLETSGDNLSSALAAFDAATTSGQKQSAAASSATALTAFSDNLNKVNNKALDADVFAGGILTIPNKKFGVGLHVSGRANFGAKFNYASSDQALINGLANDLSLCAADPTANAANCNNAQATVDSQGQISNLQSTLTVRGLAVTEVGLAFARRFESLANTDVGLTVKAQKVRTFDYVVTAQQTEINLDAGQKDESSANFDLGITKTYGDAYKAGLVVKNVLKKDYTTVLGNKIELKPQARLGLSHHRGWANVGLDVDLTKNDPVAPGFDLPTQFAAIGAELDLFSTLQLRLGYRHDLAGNYDGLPSVGLGFSPFGVHIDLSVAGNDKEVAAAFQLGFNF